VARLSESDYRGILEFVHAAGEVDGTDPFPEHVLARLRELVPCDTVSYVDFDPHCNREGHTWRTGVRFAGEPRAPVTPAICEAHAQLIYQYPYRPWSPEARRALRWSDLLSRREWHALDLYWEVGRALEGEYELRLPGGQAERIPLRRAMNAILRDAFAQDCARGLARWNRELASRGLEQRLALPHVGFNRKVGAYAGQSCDPSGNVMPPEEFAQRRGEWLPTEQDRARNAELMQPVYEPGKVAGWIAPPAKGINGQSLDFEYVILS